MVMAVGVVTALDSAGRGNYYLPRVGRGSLDFKMKVSELEGVEGVS